ncbi:MULTISPECIES: M20 family metallopeptidase [Achromobacter]|uniref:Amidohydrolase n=1 Tax=Achromobacter aegrifaciens TaxID=1287736 RepID=A0ABU2DFT5_ACHAE|nr:MULTISPECIES: amidohydrolase [Achromobacter]MDR7946966.1 amidohydrolase [Achromobacter aegrifaciens]
MALPNRLMAASSGLMLALGLTLPVAKAASDAGLLQEALQRADQTESEVIAWRRHIHQHPELSYQETETAKYIADALRAMPGITVETGIARTGVKAVLKGGKPGPVVALRADMDALPVEERNDLPFRSQAKAVWRGEQVSVSHACGHDTHVAMLLGAAKALSAMQDDLPGTIVFLFQPAEEWGPDKEPSGARAMIAQGVLENPKVDVVFGQHISAGAPSGTIAYRAGPTMASGDRFEISLHGKGGHGGRPWTANPALVPAAELTLALQGITSSKVDQSDGVTVLSIGMLQSGRRANILPESAELAGTVRSLSSHNQRIVHEAIRARAEHIAQAYGLSSKVNIYTGYEVVDNDKSLTGSLIPAWQEAAGAGKTVEMPAPSTGSEDFGAYGVSGKVPSVFWFINASPLGDKSGAPNHSPEFAIDENALRVGVRALVASALTYMDKQ